MSKADAVPWWLVPNVLALDAPAVAVAWQRFLGGRAGAAVPWAASAALAAAAWAVYLADRRLDAHRGRLDADRHRVAARWPTAFAAGAVLAAGLALAAATQLPAAYLRYGSAVGLGVAGYLALVHLGRVPLGGKEFLVGVGFAAGVAAPLAVEAPSADWLPVVAAFGGLCWLNCRLIDRWEAGTNPGAADALLGLVLLVAAAALPPAVGAAVAGAVFGLGAVHLFLRRRPRPARVLADVALLTPLLCGALP